MLAIVPFLNNNNSFSNTAMAQGYYGDDSSYSQYPTEDKKYECRTGPFEGFFVGSVEFCKHVKFDDKRKDARDNRTGTQGPPGPPGPQGIQGIQGPRGFNGTDGVNGTNGAPRPNQILNSSLYVEIGELNATTADPTSETNSTAFCDPGDTALSGSYVLNAPGAFQVIDFPTENIDGWQVEVIGPSLGIQAIVVCFDNPPPH
jgi:hypothetical protein